MSLNTAQKPKYATKTNNGSCSFTNADTAGVPFVYTNYKTVFTADATFGSIVDSISIVSDDTANKIIHLAVYGGGVLRHLLSITVTLGAGTNATTTAIDVLSLSNAFFLPSGANGKKYLRLNAGELLVASIAVIPNVGKTVEIISRGLDYEA